MAKSFYFYDLETSGTQPRWDRIMQFAGLRTDMNLEPIGDEYVVDVRLPDDVLPDPVATTVTGITPQRTHAQGVSEWQALAEVHHRFAQPGTCVAGYNSLRFDDEFIRFGFYRNLRDPYAREWQNGNSRWDLVDLVRAQGALRPDGMEWPHDEEGFPVYRLEALTQANGIEHGNAHDALSDVLATVALARLLKQAQPKLFAYYLDCRYKKNVRAVLEPYNTRLCVHVSGMYPKERYRTSAVLPIARHPINSNSVIVADLGEDVEMLIHEDERALKERLFTPGAQERPPLKEIRINRCPFVADMAVLTDDNLARTGIDPAKAEKRARRLRQPAVQQRIINLYRDGRPGKAEDVDAALYDGFLQDSDRSRCADFTQALASGEWRSLDFQDKRLLVLAERLKARSFADMLSAEERQAWTEFVRDKLGAGADAPWRSFARYANELDVLAERGEHADVVEALRSHGEALKARYGIG